MHTRILGKIAAGKGRCGGARTNEGRFVDHVLTRPTAQVTDRQVAKEAWQVRPMDCWGIFSCETIDLAHTRMTGS